MTDQPKSPDATTEMILERLQALEEANRLSEMEKTQLKAENTILRNQLQSTSRRQMTEAEGLEVAKKIIDFNRSRAPRNEGRYNWKIIVAPRNKFTGEGNPVEYGDIWFRCDTRRASDMLAEYNRQVGTDLKMQHCKLMLEGHKPLPEVGEEPVANKQEEQLFPA